MEKIKYNAANQINSQLYFWRTYTQSEVDLVEDYQGQLRGYECKSSEKKNNKISRAFVNDYPKATARVITPLSFEQLFLQN